MKAEVIIRAEVSTVIEVEYGIDEDGLDRYEFETLEDAMEDAVDRFEEQVTEDFDGWMVDADVWANEYAKDQMEAAREQTLICRAAAVVKEIQELEMLSEDQIRILLDAIYQ